METTWLTSARRELLADVAGAVVEIGAGTGKNLAHYPATVSHLTLTEPTAAMRDLLRPVMAAAECPFPVDLVDATADRIPLPDASVDAVVSTLVFCSVPDLARVTQELHRVLRPGGTVRFIEHVAATGAIEARAQRLIDPLWTWIEGSCHLDHDSVGALRAAGFVVDPVTVSRPKGQPPLLRDIAVGVATRR